MKGPRAACWLVATRGLVSAINQCAALERLSFRFSIPPFFSLNFTRGIASVCSNVIVVARDLIFSRLLLSLSLSVECFATSVQT